MTKSPSNERLEKIRDYLTELTLNATDAEVAENALAHGTNLEKQAIEFRARFEQQILSAAKHRMAEARAAIATHGVVRRTGQAPLKAQGTFDLEPARRPVANDVAAARKITMAARNGRSQSERDLQGVEEDLTELAAFHDAEKTD